MPKEYNTVAHKSSKQVVPSFPDEVNDQELINCDEADGMPNSDCQGPQEDDPKEVSCTGRQGKEASIPTVTCQRACNILP